MQVFGWRGGGAATAGVRNSYTWRGLMRVCAPSATFGRQRRAVLRCHAELSEHDMPPCLLALPPCSLASCVVHPRPICSCPLLAF
jgi:hypothetical protein